MWQITSIDFVSRIIHWSWSIAVSKFVLFLTENLEVALEPVQVQHLEVGRYFEKFCNVHYVPNAEKQMEYPQDGEVRLRFSTLVKSKWNTMNMGSFQSILTISRWFSFTFIENWRILPFPILPSLSHRG